MEENLQNDKFEEFLKKALENYEENPPESVWIGVNAAMPEAGMPQASGGNNLWGSMKNAAFGTRKAMALLSLPLLVLLGLAYYQQKQHTASVHKLQKELSDISAELKNARAQQSELLDVMHQRISELEQKNAAQSTETYEEKKADKFSSRYVEQPPSLKNVAGESIQNTQKDAPTSPKIAGAASPNTQKEAVTQANSPKTDAEISASAAVAAPSPNDKQTSTTPITSEPDAAQKIGNSPANALESLPNIAQKPATSLENDLKLPSTLAPIVKVFTRTPKKWEIGVTNAWLTKEHELPTPKPDGPGGPGGPGGDLEREPNKDFNSKGWAVGLHVARKVNSNWSVASGLSYLNLSNQQCFEPKFRFDNGHQHGGGGGPHDPEAYDFDLAFQVPGYEVELTLRAEEVDTNQMHHPDDDLDMKINTSQVITSLQVPLLAQYSISRGRTALFLTGGLVGEYQLSNKLTFDNFDIKNNDFKLTQMQPPNQKKQLEDKYALHYQLGFGIKYQLSPQVGLQLQGNMVNSLAQRFDDDFLRGNTSTRGIQANIVYQL